MTASLLGTFTAAEGAGNLTTGSRTSTSGTLITAHAVAWDTPSRPTITLSDNKSNSYTQTDLAYGASADQMAMAYNAAGTRGASHTVSATFSAGVNGCSLVACEWDGVASSPTVVTNTGTNTAASTIGVSVTAGASSLFVGMMGYSGSATTITPTGGATEAVEVDENATFQPQNVSYKVGLSGSQSIDWNLGAGRNNGAIVMSFTESSGGTIITRTVDDSIAVTDGVVSSTYRNRGPIESTVLSDSILRSAIFTEIATDLIAASDSAVLRFIRTRRLDDGATIADDFIKTVTGGNFTVFNITVTDPIALVDAVALWYERNRGVLETIAIADQVGKTSLRSRTATDNVDLSDQAIRTFRLVRRLDDAFSVIDSVAALFLGNVVGDGSRIVVGYNPPAIALGYVPQPYPNGDPDRILLGGGAIN